MAAALLTMCLLVFFWPAIFAGRILLPADLIFDLDPLWQPLAPGGYTHPSNGLLSDQVSMYYPWRVFARRWAAPGELPLWNPDVNGGQPFVGNAQSALFDPFHILTYALPLNAVPAAVALLRLFVAGFFTYLLAREIGIGWPGALLAMVAFAFSGPLIGWVGYPLLSVVAWLPVMLWTTERALVRKSGGYAVGCGLAIGAQFLGGHPETSFHVLLVWLAYAVYRMVDMEGWRLSRLWPHLLRMAASGVIGGLLGAIQVLPFLDAVSQSAIVIQRQIESTSRSTSLFARLFLEWHAWPTVVTVLLPRYFGSPVDASYLYPYSNYLEQNAYVGVLPLALALAVTWQAIRLRSIPHRSHILFLALMAILSLGTAVRLPVLNAINYLPLFEVSAPGRLRMVYALAVSLLAGMSLDRIRTGDRITLRLVVRGLAYLALANLALVACAYIGLALGRGAVTDLGRGFIDANWGTPYYSKPLEHYYALLETRLDQTLARLCPGNVLTYLPVLVAVIWFALYWLERRTSRVHIWSWVAMSLTTADAFFLGAGFNPTIARQELFPTPGAIRFLQQDSSVYRICATGLILYPNASMIYGLDDVRGYEPVVPARYVALIDRLEGHYRLRTNSLFANVDEPLLDLLNVRYVLSDQPLSGRWELVYQGEGSVRVYRSREALPRAFVVYRAKVVDNAAQSLNRTTDHSFDFRRSVILEEQPFDGEGWGGEPTDPPIADIVGYEPDRVTVQVETSVSGLLVLTDSYMRGWRASVDGDRVHLYAADHAFRAVEVPAGRHQVVFSYEPLAFRFGEAITVVSLVALATWALLVARRARRSGGADG